MSILFNSKLNPEMMAPDFLLPTEHDHGEDVLDLCEQI